MSAPSSPRRSPIRLIGGLVLPLVAFFVLLKAIGNATGALAITDAIPLLFLLAYGIWQHRIEPVALIAVVVFAIALVLTIAFGGSSLPLELRRAVFPGAVGLACLISLAVRRPLLLVAATRLPQVQAARTAASRPDLDTPAGRRGLTVLTAIIGVTAVVDAAAQVVLALTLSTTHFVVDARIATYAIIGCGLAVCALYVRLTRVFQRKDGTFTSPGDAHPGDAHAGHAHAGDAHPGEAHPGND